MRALLSQLVIIAALGATVAACSRDGVSAQARGNDPNAPVAPPSCSDLPDGPILADLLTHAPIAEGEAGGLFSGHLEWAAVVDRQGVICAVAASAEDPAALWPGGVNLAKEKAYTANAFSADGAPMSTARLYTFAQPGHSLAGILAASPFKPDCMTSPDHPKVGIGKLCGGAIALGGGVPLYRDSRRVGGLGVSGDTACTDHEMAKRMRHMARLDPEQGELSDDIVYATVDGPSVYAHPVCANTWRNGKKIGDEIVAHEY